MIVMSLFARYNEELQYVNLWAIRNKLHVNTLNSKEIGLHRQGNRCIVDQPAVVCGIQQVAEVKLLGVWFNHKLYFSSHVNRVLATVNQRFHLLNRLRRQGLNSFGVKVVFNAVKIPKFVYACHQAFPEFLCASDLSRFRFP
jgi:hypothetical protein